MAVESGRERLTVFSRLPLPGQSKTRLIPALGADGAARLQQAMSLRAITLACLCARRRPGLEARLALSGPLERATDCFGRLLPVEAQASGDLGERMAASFRAGLEAGASRQLIIGSDIPGLSVERLQQALDALQDKELVLGPARDGGYYLIGLGRELPPALFHSMPWGGPEVLGLTLARAAEAGLSCRLLPTLDDVDEAADLGHWRRARRQAPALSPDDGVSVILPVLNEAERIPAQVRRLFAEGADEVIVADGGSEDGSVQAAAEAGARVIHTPPGRAVQMNHAAREARHPLLLFLHADTRLAEGWRDPLFAALSGAGGGERVVAGAFRFKVDGRGLRYRLMEWLVALRCRLLRLPYGDQGLFCRHEVFFRVGGFPETPLMEDYLLVKRLRREGRIHLLPLPALSSARNWERAGFWRVFLAHRLVLIGHALGVPLPRLARLRRRLLRGPERKSA